MTRWTDALKVWNSLNIHHNDREWAVPRKGTPDHEKVVKIMHDAKRGSEKHAATRTVAVKPLDDDVKKMINEIVDKHTKKEVKEEKKEEKKAPAPRKQLATKAAKRRPEPHKREAIKLHLHNEIATLEKHLKDDVERLARAGLTPTQRNTIETEGKAMKKSLNKLKKELKELE